MSFSRNKILHLSPLFCCIHGRGVHPEQIDRKFVTLIISFFLPFSPLGFTVLHAAREGAAGRLARRNFNGARHPTAIPSSNVEVARATWAAARVYEEKGTPLTEVLFYFALPYGATDEGRRVPSIYSQRKREVGWDEEKGKRPHR